MSTPLAGFPDSARIWTFAAERPVTGAAEARLLAAVDDFVSHWQAHGTPLRATREWRDSRFLVIAVDPTEAQASGCSIDGLFRTLRRIEGELGVTLVAGGRVFYRDEDGTVRTVPRATVRDLVASGAITATTRVLDTSLTRLADWRARFEVPAAESWLAAYLPRDVAGDGRDEP